MAQSVSLGRLVDLQLYNKLCSMFRVRPAVSNWVNEVSYRFGQWENLNVCQFVKLMDKSKDLKVLRAIALFSWNCDFSDNKFIARAISIVQESPDVFLEAAILHSGFGDEELRNNMIFSLGHTKRSSGIEYVAALTAVEGCIEDGDEIAYRLLTIISGYLKELDIIGDCQVFGYCSDLPHKFKESCSTVLLALDSLVTSVPNKDGNECYWLSSWGIDFQDQIRLCHLLQKVCSRKKMISGSTYKTKKLEEMTAQWMCGMDSEWGEIEQKIARSHYGSKLYCNYWGNSKYRGVINLLHKGSIDQLNRSCLTEMVREGILELDDDMLKQAYEMNRELFGECLSLPADHRNLYVFSRLVENSCVSEDEYLHLWEAYYAKWETRQSFEFLKKNGASDVILESLDSFELDYLDKDEQETLCQIVYDWYMRTGNAGRIEELFDCSFDTEEAIALVYGEKKTKQNFSELSGDYSFFARKHSIENQDTFSMLSGCKNIEKANAVFSHVKEKKIKKYSVDEFNRFLDMIDSASMIATLLEYGCSMEALDALPWQSITTKMIINHPWILDSLWLADYEECHSLRRYNSEEMEFLHKTGGKIPVCYCKDYAKVLPLLENDNVDSEIVISLLQDQTDISCIEKLGEVCKKNPEDLRVSYELLLREVPEGFINRMIDLGRLDILHEVLEYETIDDSWVLFKPELYNSCNFKDISLESLCREGEVFNNIDYSGSRVPEILKCSKREQAVLIGNLGIDYEQAEKISSIDIINVETLTWRLLRKSIKQWKKLFGLDSEEETVTVLSYLYRWDSNSVNYRNMIIQMRIRGCLETSIRYVLKNNYKLREISRGYSWHNIQLPVFCEASDSGVLDCFLQDANSMPNSDIIQNAARHAFMKILTETGQNQHLPASLYQSDKELFELAGQGRLTPLGWLKKSYELKEKFGFDKTLLMWLNFLDGTWFYFKDSLYCIRMDSTGIGVRCCMGEDILPNSFHRYDDGYLRGYTNAPCQIELTEKECNIV